MPFEAAAGRNTLQEAPPRPDLEIEVTPFPAMFLVGERVDRQRLAELLDGRDGISCAPDSELLTDLAAVVRRNCPALFHYGYPEQYWYRRTAGFFEALQTEYALSRGFTRWAATTDPAALALLDRLFPRCRVVRIVPATRLPRSKAISDDLPRRFSGRYHQLSAGDLLRRPDATTAAVLSFLDRSPPPLIAAGLPQVSVPDRKSSASGP
jgi:hypothetical protein